MFGGFDFVIMALSCWRLTSLVVYEDGPFHVFSKFREWIGLEEDGSHPDKFLPSLISCAMCFSVWVGLTWLGYLLAPVIAISLSGIFALSAVACIIDRYME